MAFTLMLSDSLLKCRSFLPSHAPSELCQIFRTLLGFRGAFVSLDRGEPRLMFSFWEKEPDDIRHAKPANRNMRRTRLNTASPRTQRRSQEREVRARRG